VKLVRTFRAYYPALDCARSCLINNDLSQIDLISSSCPTPPPPTSSRPSIPSCYHPSHHDTLDSRLATVIPFFPSYSSSDVGPLSSMTALCHQLSSLGRLAHYCVMARDSDAMTRGSHVIEPHVSMRLRRRLARRSIGRGTPLLLPTPVTKLTNSTHRHVY